MIKVVTSDEMREMDRYTIQDLGVPGVVLMENAGVGIFRIIREMYGDVEGLSAFIFCGKGNNGGDGFVIARHLWDAGAHVKIFIAGADEDIKGDARINFDIVQKLNIPHHFVSKLQDFEDKIDPSPDLIVDALLGTGIKGAVRGFFKEVIRYINEFKRPIVSVDVASGLNADTPAVEGDVVQADVTVTMALPKICHIFYPARNYVGELFVADIGIPHTTRNSEAVKVQVIDKADIVLPERLPDSHKYHNGKIAVIAGSPGFTGAAALTAQAALNIGAGLIRLAVPNSLNSILESKLTEVITHPYHTGNGDSLSSDDLPQLAELLEWCDVLAIGPGLGRSDEAQEAIIEILKNFDKPAVIDADALFALANNPLLLKKAHPNWVLTPHHGEFYRFLKNTSKEDFKFNFVTYARQFSNDYQINLLLKGSPSLISDPAGNVFINTTGNAGLASGGTGDVLTGFVAGLLGQKMEPRSAAYTSNYLHGLCADEIAGTNSIYSLNATDLLEILGEVIQKHFLSQE